MALISLTVKAQDNIIDHEGNKYIIHVERLNPDKEMTLLDVLHICPELMSRDGKTLTANYVLSVDDIFLSVDYEPLLEGIKACDLSEVTVCTYGAVNNATDGVSGSIDLQFREGQGLNSKVALSASTCGNGRLYADLTTRSEKVTVRAFAQMNMHHEHVDAASGSNVTSRHGVENAMVFVDWQMSDDDLLKLKLSQGYGEQEDNTHHVSLIHEDVFNRQRWGELVATYERTLNEQEAGLYFETGMNYANCLSDGSGVRTAMPWWIAECSVPFMNQKLSMTAGYEGGYTNIWYPSLQREQNLYSDLYVQFDYQNGPWTVSLGDRFRHNNFWDKHYNEALPHLWSYNRNDHAFHALVGYQAGHHILQGVVSRTYFNPLISDFHDYLSTGAYVHATDYKTNLAWRSEARYTYQTERLVATGSLTHQLLTDRPEPNEALTGLGATVTWHQGAFRLTSGANFYHLHISGDDAVNNNYYVLKLVPTLLLGHGFRLTSTLLYNSRIDAYDQHPHLYASVKVNKELGKRCNVYADFHDLAGQLKGNTTTLTAQSFHSRALTVGLTWYY